LNHKNAVKREAVQFIYEEYLKMSEQKRQREYAQQQKKEKIKEGNNNN